MSISNTVNESDQILREGIDVNALNRNHVVWAPLIHPEVRENYYEISNSGEIRKTSDQYMMKIATDRIDQYRFINLVRPSDSENKNRKVRTVVHRLVALSFLQNPNDLLTVDHINRDRQDNHVSNLRWASHSDQNANQNERNRENIADRDVVEQLNMKTKEVINTYDSMTIAAENMVGKKGKPGTKSSISAACRNGNPQYGYYWRKKVVQSDTLEELEAAPAPGIELSTPTVLDILDDIINEDLQQNVENLTFTEDLHQTVENTVMTETPEEWRPIITPNGIVIPTHMISNKGCIQNIKTGKIKIGSSDRDALRFELKENGKKKTFGVHDLVASTYIGVPEVFQEVDIWHKNRNRNDNRVENLEWLTKSEFKLRLNYNNAKIIRVTFSEDRIEVYNSIGRAAEATCINASTISHIVNGLKPQRENIRFEIVN